jgi:hypothetical protein
VFAVEPATESPLFGCPNVVVTPHLGAATTEAQENVALQVAEQMADYLLTGAVTNALNMPSVTAEEARVMGPWIRLAGHLGNFVGQMTDEPITAINVLYDGIAAGMNLAALNCAVIAGILRRANPDVNLVSAPVIARERGIHVSTTRQDQSGMFEGYIKVTVATEARERSVAGTVFSDGKPRFIQIKGINVDAEIGANMVYTTNEDVPGSSARWAGPWGRTASTSPTSPWGGRTAAARPSRSCMWTTPCRSRSSTRCGRRGCSSRSRRCSSTWREGGRRRGAVCPPEPPEDIWDQRKAAGSQ